MKKKVLFALIALFSFLSTWAQTTEVNASGSYKATLNQAVPYVLTTQGLPEVSGFTLSGNPVTDEISPALATPANYKVYKYDEGNLVLVEKKNGADADALPIGNYYLQFQIVGTGAQNTVYVPFMVVKKGVQGTNYDVVNNAASFSTSSQNGGLAAYYAHYVWSDFGYNAGTADEPNWKTIEPGNEIDGWLGMTYDEKVSAWNNWWAQNSGQNVRNWNTAVAHEKNGEGFPWIVPFGFSANNDAVRLLFVYDDATVTATDGFKNSIIPWGNGQNGLFGGANGRTFGAASVAHEFGYPNWEITNDPNQTSSFDPAKFSMYLIPAASDEQIPAVETVTRTSISQYTLKMNNGALVYNGAPQYPTFTGGGKNAYVLENANTAEANALVENVDFTVSYTNGGDYTNAGVNKPVVITGIGKYKDSFESNFTISAFPVTADNFPLSAVGPFDFDGTDKKQTVYVVGSAVLTTGADATSLTSGTDFDAVLTKGTEAADQAVDAGTYTYSISPKGNYTFGVVDEVTITSITKSFTINAKSLSDAAAVIMPTVGEGADAVAGYVFNTKEQKPVFKTTATATKDSYVLPVAPATPGAPTEAELEKALVEGQDFTVQFSGTDYTNVGSKTYTITFQGNYSGEYNGTYTIVAKDIADDDVTKKFTEPTYNPSGTAQITADNFDFKYNNVALALATTTAGDFSWDWKEGSTGESGSQTIVVTGKGNYTGTWEKTFNVKAFAVTITPATVSKVYGEEDPLPNFSIDANSATQIEYGGEEWLYIQSFLTMERNVNDENNSDALRETVVEGGHKYAIKIADPNKECKYEIIIQNNDGILMIYPAPLTVTVANNSKTYGDADPNFIADKNATNKFKITKPNAQNPDAPIDVTNAKDFVDATKNLKDVLNIGRVAGEDVKYVEVEGEFVRSGYDFTWDNPNYTVTFEPTIFTINPKAVTIDVATNGDGYVYTGAEQNPIPTVTISGTDTQLANPKDFFVTWEAGTGLNDLINVTEGVETSYNKWPKVIVTANPQGNYTLKNQGAKAEKSFNIVKAELNISAITDNSKTYGTSDPNPLAKITFAQGKGPKGRDYYNEDGTTNITFSKQLIIREAGEHTGNYEISINPEATTRNYNIVSTATANFHIYRSDKDFVISFDKLDGTAGNKYVGNTTTITYGDPIDLTTLIKVTAPEGYTGNATADLLAYAKENVKKYQKDEETGEKVYIDENNAGQYKLTIDDCPTALGGGYGVYVDEGILNINPYPLFIISYGTKEYGDAEPAYTWDVYEYKQVGSKWQYVKTDKVNKEDVPEAEFIGNSDNLFENALRYTISRETGENVADYKTTIRNSRTIIVPSTNPFFPQPSFQTKVYGDNGTGIAYDGNYSFEFKPGIFSITRRTLTVTVEGNSKKYGENDPEKRLKEVVPEEEEEVEEGEEGEEGEEPEVAETPVSIFTKGLVTITVTNALTESQAEVIANYVDYTNRVKGEDAGFYAVNGITFKGSSNPGNNSVDNYNLSFSKNANFEIEKRLLKVTAHDQSIPYANPLVVDPYDLTIDGIIIDGVYSETAKDVNYEDVLTQVKGTLNATRYDRVDEVFQPLEVAEGKTAVGKFHKDAFSLKFTEFGAKNYELEFINGKLYIEQASDLYLDMANLAQALNDHKGRTVTVHMTGAEQKEEGCDPFRRFAKHIWYTLVLPFDARPRDIVKPFEYAVIDIMDTDNEIENDFSLAITTKEVKANTPFIIQTDESWNWSQMANVKWENVKIADFDYVNEDPTSTDAAGNMFIGTYKPKSEFTAANYIMKENSGDFFRFIAGESGVEPSYAMKQTEAYLQTANADAPARISIEDPNGTVTAIEFVGAEGVATTSAAEGWYTINGVKLEGEPTTSGTYIFNGKKVYIQK